MKTLDEFIAFADNSHIIIADYESRKARLDAMIIIRETDCSPLLDKWITEAYRRLEVTQTLYNYAKAAQKLPIEELRVIWEQLKELRQ